MDTEISTPTQRPFSSYRPEPTVLLARIAAHLACEQADGIQIIKLDIHLLTALVHHAMFSGAVTVGDLEAL